ncbi:ATP-binding protein [Chloracidobacterium sp. D]|uniref:ATP-binding protein n=1 Tax=Chloracidobacterium sp. D TaxID=2821536 RepID=UPI001B8B813E|nr:ATP-binding protein [Chloracidobacterium sp. D]QUV82434.1 ATP-binding protein [Chloracidobacterium sp. D]
MASENPQITHSDSPADAIGRASATEREPNTADRFSFWIRPSARLNPFDIVAAEHLEGSHTYGLVTNIRHVTDAAGHLSNFISNDFGELVEEPNTPRQGANVADVSVLSNDKEIYMPVQSEARVRFAGEAGIHNALGIDSMAEKEQREGRTVRIPAGLIQMSNGSEAVAYLDVDYVLGPEAGHVNISGISGLATKTSYITFLIQSILQTVSAENIAVILLNVKYDDLLHIHEARPLTEDEKSLWEKMGLRSGPWQDDRVHYLLPWGKQTQTTGRPNSFGESIPPHRTYAYDLKTTAPKLDLLLSHVPDPWDTLGALIGEVSQGLQSNEPTWREIKTWQDLLSKPPLSENGTPKSFKNIAVSSVGRFLRLLRRAVQTRQSGVFVSQLSTRMTTIEAGIGEIKGGHTYVVDIARLTDVEQTLVFGDVLRTVYALYSGETGLATEDDLPEKVIIFVDELNKYAPSRGEAANSPIVEQVLDIAERGRSFGIILFSAQQFLSAVHPRVTGNAATKVLGRTDSAEVNEGNYRFLDKDIKMHLTRLDKGELILSHPIYRQPVKIRFPRPPFQQGRVKK